MNIFEKRRVALTNINGTCPYCGLPLQNSDQNKEADYMVLIHKEPSYAASPNEPMHNLSGGCISCVLHRLPMMQSVHLFAKNDERYGIAELFTFSAYGYNNDNDKSAPITFYSMTAAQKFVAQEKGKVYKQFMTSVDRSVISIKL